MFIVLFYKDFISCLYQKCPL